MIYVLDSSALIAYLDAEPGGAVVRDLLSLPESKCSAHAISVCEVYYDFVRRAGSEVAWVLVEELVRAGVHIREDMDPDLWRTAGDYKAEWRRISLADCLCVALANRDAAELVTADRSEMEPLAGAGVCRVRFVR